jgi:hypothetical protein
VTAQIAVPLVLLVGAGWLGLLAWLNVRERRAEIGLWRALGHGSARIAGLLLGKAVLLGAFGAVVGCGLGTSIALSAGPEIFQVTAKSLRAEPTLLLWAILLRRLAAKVYPDRHEPSGKFRRHDPHPRSADRAGPRNDPSAGRART